MTAINSETAIKILSDVVAIQSVNDHEKAVAAYLQQLFTSFDIESKVIPIEGDRGNLVAEIGSGQPVLALSGHMDVVEAGEPTAWQFDPFKLTEDNGELYGRGAVDMKGGLVALVIAMIELKKQGLPKKGTIRLLATMGEEVGEAGSAAFYEQGYMKDVAGLIIGEPNGYQIGYAQKGSMDIQFTSQGQAAHSSMPDKGYNAIDPLMALLNEANQFFREPTFKSSSMGPLTFNTTVFTGGNQVNSIPDQASAQVNIRTVPEFTNDMVQQRLTELIQRYNENGAQIKMDIYMSEPPVAVDQNNTLVQISRSVVGRYTPDDVPVAPITAVTDASNLTKDKPASFPFIILGPGNTTVHQVNEHLNKQMFLNFIQIYQTVFDEFLNQ
ncbi:succinyl-diaminopimelate desuccinylase [Agrilactobacillus composti DSM 18527 = JCM 14202]|uniref:Probable succinyl-diaminopimelate desuccinylase n=1 Tax=Agrilactobacillus composti DSM 18527 = JCM 14202 TaxID=1423734 RepID=X0PHM4_9LACO|nr:ArgE/DapE family deacylase [Agrilactobacillus composti]KRM32990.1 succinyl-diaminopimelate desuccinylase [Agrilactobacillus composti DSM 18527 = JCM 14202]GAF41503.1 acetylornithine deacetylase [Agrilactobacillus composti DSM 18527 = JCM 14202]